MVDEASTLLVLGSMPSVTSLNQQQYYAHPRNAFWPLLAELMGFELYTDYARNIAEVTARGIAIWDVIGECERVGSLDSAIISGSERVNPIPHFLENHPRITRIALNGGTASRLFKRHCQPDLNPEQYEIFSLPSTSPANARMNFTAKCTAWQPALKDTQQKHQETNGSINPSL